MLAVTLASAMLASTTRMGTTAHGTVASTRSPQMRPWTSARTTLRVGPGTRSPRPSLQGASGSEGAALARSEGR